MYYFKSLVIKSGTHISRENESEVENDYGQDLQQCSGSSLDHINNEKGNLESVTRRSRRRRMKKIKEANGQDIEVT